MIILYPTSAEVYSTGIASKNLTTNCTNSNLKTEPTATSLPGQQPQYFA